jgi:hypoxanthine phosphoribosyltransferase
MAEDVNYSWKREVEALISAEEIQEKIAELARRITKDYAGKDLTIVGVLKGCFLFMADLCRKIDLPLTCDFLGVSSYGDKTKTSGVIRITSDLSQPIEGRHVLIVEDIVDSGRTLNYLMKNLSTRHPASLKICSLLDKKARREIDSNIDYVGFQIPNKFVIGYGLDYKGRFRNLGYIGTMDNIEDD